MLCIKLVIWWGFVYFPFPLKTFIYLFKHGSGTMQKNEGKVKTYFKDIFFISPQYIFDWPNLKLLGRFQILRVEGNLSLIFKFSDIYLHNCTVYVEYFCEYTINKMHCWMLSCKCFLFPPYCQNHINSQHFLKRITERKTYNIMKELHENAYNICH